MRICVSATSAGVRSGKEARGGEIVNRGANGEERL